MWPHRGSGSSTTGRSISCSSRLAARRPRSPIASRSNSPTSILLRRPSACSTPASATARPVAGHARDARPLSNDAALRGRQGDLLRGRAPHARENGGSPVRASGDRPRPDQSLLCRGAMADAALRLGRAKLDLEGRRALRQHVARLRRADRQSRGVPGGELASRDQDLRQSRLSPADHPDAQARGSYLPSRSDFTASGATHSGL